MYNHGPAAKSNAYSVMSTERKTMGTKCKKRMFVQTYKRVTFIASNEVITTRALHTVVNGCQPDMI